MCACEWYHAKPVRGSARKSSAAATPALTSQHRSTNPCPPSRQLLRAKEVIFAGYKGKKSPREVMDDALSCLCDEFQDIQGKFQVGPLFGY